MVAASLIFLYHVGLSTKIFGSIYAEHAVTFFVILIPIAAKIFSRNKIPSPRKSWHYTLARTKELYPTFALFSIAIFASSYAVHSVLGRPYSLFELGANLLGISQYIGLRYMSYTMWFIPFTVQIFLILPLLQRIHEKVGDTIFLVGAACISTFLVIITYHFVPAPKALLICREWSPLFRLPEVACGLILAKSVSVTDLARKILFCFLVFAACASPIIFTPVGSYSFLSPSLGLVTSLLIVVLGLILHLIAMPFVPGKWWRTGGAASYPFFLGHGIGLRFIAGRNDNSLIAFSLYWLGFWLFSITWVILGKKFRAFASRAS